MKRNKITVEITEIFLLDEFFINVDDAIESPLVIGNILRKCSMFVMSKWIITII